MNDKFAEGFISGCLFTLILCAMSFMYTDFAKLNGLDVFAGRDFLIASFSIAAAAFALESTRRQMRHTQNIEDRKNYNLLTASKTDLPRALADIMDVCRSNIRANFIKTERMSIKSSSIDVIKSCIAYSTHENQNRLANILRHIQVAESRNDSTNLMAIDESIDDPSIQGTGVLNAIDNSICWSVIHALSESAFKFARGACETIPTRIEFERVKSAYLQSHVYLEKHPLVEEILLSRENRGRLEHNWSEN